MASRRQSAVVPLPVAPLQQRLRLFRPPAAGVIVWEVAGRQRLPHVEDRLDDRPAGLDHVGPLEQRRVPGHAVVEQPLVPGAGLASRNNRRNRTTCRRCPAADCGPGTFAPKLSAMPSSGWMCSTSRLGSSCSTGVSRKSMNGGRLNWMAIVVSRFGRHLPVRQVDRHVGPTPVVDEQLQRNECLGDRLRVDVRFLPISGCAFPSIVPGPYCPRTVRRNTSSGVIRLHRAQDLRLLVADRIGPERARRLHRRQRDQLKEVIGNHVAQRAGLVVVAAAPFDARRFRQP